MTDEKLLAYDKYLGPCLVRKTFVTEGFQYNVGPSGTPSEESPGGHLTLQTQILSYNTILVFISEFQVSHMKILLKVCISPSV